MKNLGLYSFRFLLSFAFLVLAAAGHSQTRPYIGYAYPAGGQRGSTFQIKLGGQNLDDVHDVLLTGPGISAKVVNYFRRLNPQEMQLLNEQARELRKATSAVASAEIPLHEAQGLLARIERRTVEYVQTPACASLSALVFVEVTIAPDAPAGARELRLAAPRGVSNPLVFHVGELPEHTRKPMLTANIQVLGKEASALRKRPPAEAEARISLPCTVNGQIASGEVNRYRFRARRGQRLVLSTQARQLLPFIADAVPGWFQPILAVSDAQGKELAFADDFRFKPDPTLLFEVPKDGEYILAITDAIYRGREDFVYRVTIGELPFVTSIYPLGARAGAAVSPKLRGWNLGDTSIAMPAAHSAPGLYQLAASRQEIYNPIPFALDGLPEKFEQEPNNAPAEPQPVKLPIIINGRIEKPGDSDIFRFAGKSNDTIVAEVTARRLDSPLDSLIQLTSQDGHVLAFSDDREDLRAGINTHHADSWLMATLPADGDYFLHLTDTARHGGKEYGYRLRMSPPRPDFELRVVPSSISFRTNSSATVTVYAQRKDGFARSINLQLKDPPPGFSASPAKLPSGQTSVRFTIRGPSKPTENPVSLTIIGTGPAGQKQVVHEAVPAEDRMQAFLWRQLVPAAELKAVVYDPGYEPPVARPAPYRPPAPAPATNVLAGITNNLSGTNTIAAAKPKFSKSQVTRRLRELKLLYQEGLLTDAFYHKKCDECETMQ